MFDWLEFKTHDGPWKEKDVKLLALHSCAFCTRGMKYLEEQGITYQYVYVDVLPKEDKRRVSEEFREKFNQRGLFPALIVDDEDYQLGFIEKAWAKSLGLE